MVNKVNLSGRLFEALNMPFSFASPPSVGSAIYDPMPNLTVQLDLQRAFHQFHLPAFALLPCFFR